MITQKELKKHIKYNQDTGIVTRASDYGMGQKAGKVCKWDRIMINNIRYRTNILIWLYMTGSMPKHEVVHVDHNVKNNIFSNLNDSPPSIKQKNLRLSMGNISGLTGVTLVRGRWVAQIGVNDKSKSKHLLMTDDFFEACCARMSANNKLGFHRNHGLKH